MPKYEVEIERKEIHLRQGMVCIEADTPAAAIALVESLQGEIEHEAEVYLWETELDQAVGGYYVPTPTRLSVRVASDNEPAINSEEG